MNSLSCPYCNSQVPVPAQVAADQRVPCPRCGASFPYRVMKPGVGENAQPVPVNQATGTALQTDAGQQRRSNRVTATIVLGVMAVCALVALVYALNTRTDRRGRDAVNPLGYLPGDTNAIAAVNVTQLLKDPAGREFANQFKFTFGPASVDLANIERLTGLKRGDIDVVVLGLKLSDGIPRITLVAQTREPYDPDVIQKALKTDRKTERGEKILHRFSGGGALFQPSVWFATENILVVCLNKPEDFDAIPSTPHTGVEHLSAPLQGLLQDQLGRDAAAWLIVHAESWDDMLFKPRLLPEKEDKAIMARVQTVGVWLRFDETIFVNAACNCRDNEAAEALRQYLLRKKVVEEENVQVQKETWVIVKSPTSLEAIQRALKQSFALPFGIK